MPDCIEVFLERDKFKCELEPDFLELHEELGNAEMQEAIREQNPGRHCSMLMQSPTACNGCPRNPFSQHKTKPPPKGWLDACAQAFLVYDTAKLLGADLADLTPAEFEMARVVQNKMGQKERHESAQWVAVEMGKILSKMFGKK